MGQEIMPEVEPSPHSPQHTDDYVPWWVWLCRMLWKILAYLGTAVVLGAVASLIATWLTTPQGVIPANTPFRQLLASWPIVLPVGCCLLLLALFIRTLGRWPTSVKNEGESSGQIKKVAAPLETAVPPSPSTTTQHLSSDARWNKTGLLSAFTREGLALFRPFVAWVALARPRWLPGPSSNFASVN